MCAYRDAYSVKNCATQELDGSGAEGSELQSLCTAPSLGTRTSFAKAESRQHDG